MNQTKNKALANIEHMFDEGHINNWQKDFYSSIAKEGMSDELLRDMIEDHGIIKELHIDNEADWDRWQYIDTYAESLFSHHVMSRYGSPIANGLSDKQLLSLKMYLFKLGKKGNFHDSLLNRLIDKWYRYNFLTDLDSTIKAATAKLAYPNTEMWIQPAPQWDAEGKWIDTLHNVYVDVVKMNIPQEESFKRHTHDWDPKEAQAFEQWAKYYRSQEHKKYGDTGNNQMQKTAFKDMEFNPPDLYTMQERQREEQKIADELNAKLEEQRKSFDRWKKALTGRLQASMRMLDKLQPSISTPARHNISNNLHDLSKFVDTLEFEPQHMEATKAILENKLVRLANMCESGNYPEGAYVLTKMAKDLSEPDSISKWGAADLSSIIENIEQIDQALKSKDLVRKIMRADIALSELGMASYFPELSQAIARVSESFEYASNKTSEVLSRLRGGERSKALQQAEKMRIQEPTPTALTPKKKF